MSIIDQALKKVQQDRQAQQTKKSSPIFNEQSIRAGASPASKGAKNLFSSGRLLLLLTFLILLGVMLLKFPRMIPKEKKSPVANLAAQDIEVTGIVTMGDKKVALINNEIFEVGDTMDGMTLTSISKDSVQLLKDGRLQDYKVRK